MDHKGFWHILLFGSILFIAGCGCNSKASFSFEKLWPFGKKDKKVEKTSVPKQTDPKILEILKQKNEITSLEQKLKIRELRAKLSRPVVPVATKAKEAQKNQTWFLRFRTNFSFDTKKWSKGIHDWWITLINASATIGIAVLCILAVFALFTFGFNVFGLFAEATVSLSGLFVSFFGQGVHLFITIGFFVLALIAVPFINAVFQLDLNNGLQILLTCGSGSITLATNWYKLKDAQNKAEASERKLRR